MRIRTMIAAVVAGSIAGCGSGGDDGEGAASRAPFTSVSVAETIKSAYMQDTKSDRSGNEVLVSCSDSPECEPSGSGRILHVTLEPKGPVLFEGVEAQRYLRTSLITKDNVPEDVSRKRLMYFGSDPVQLLGSEFGAIYTVYSSQETLPAQATVGDRGTVAKGTAYTDNTKSASLGASRVDWYVMAGDGTFAWVCFTFFPMLDRFVRIPSSYTDCFAVNSKAQIEKYRWMTQEYKYVEAFE